MRKKAGMTNPSLCTIASATNSTAGMIAPARRP
jgi:hypothetical protein